MAKTEHVIKWQNRHSGETGYVGSIDAEERHFNSVSEIGNAKTYPNGGLASIAVGRLEKMGEGADINNILTVVPLD